MLVLTLVKLNESLFLFKPRFNFLEIKIYLGDNMLNIADGKVRRNIRDVPLSTGCNKSVNAHNNLCFVDDGTQSINDSACPTLPRATFTLGETQIITFERVTK